MMRWAVWCVVIASAGCTCVSDPTDHVFPCANDSTCEDGYRCVDGFCSMGTAAFDAGKADAGVVHDAGTPPSGDGGVEQDCFDGIDNDGDLLTDCEDPDCALRSCHLPYNDHVCCAQSANGCTALSAVDNCGGCGIRCASGQLCVEQPVLGGFTGYCACNVVAGCPESQSCFAGSACACSGDDTCASGETCDHSLAYGVCHY